MSLSESLPEPSNPIGIDGIEFIEYATAQPQAFGALLQKMGFAAVARHRSREVMLYRQGTMNLIVNSHAIGDPVPRVAAIALRVRDAGEAFRHSLDRGAWGHDPVVLPGECVKGLWRLHLNASWRSTHSICSHDAVRGDLPNIGRVAEFVRRVWRGRVSAGWRICGGPES